MGGEQPGAVEENCLTQNILLSVADSVATIIFNRPKVMNALDWDMIVRFREVCEEVRRTEAVRHLLKSTSRRLPENNRGG